MPIVIDAIYEDGVLKPAQPLPLDEHETVRITIDSALSRVRTTAGLLGWKGDAAVIERVALDPEFGIMESP